MKKTKQINKPVLIAIFIIMFVIIVVLSTMIFIIPGIKDINKANDMVYQESNDTTKDDIDKQEDDLANKKAQQLADLEAQKKAVEAEKVALLEKVKAEREVLRIEKDKATQKETTEFFKNPNSDAYYAAKRAREDAADRLYSAERKISDLENGGIFSKDPEVIDIFERLNDINLQIKELNKPSDNTPTIDDIKNSQNNLLDNIFGKSEEAEFNNKKNAIIRNGIIKMIIGIILILIPIIYVIATFNRLILLRNRVKEKWSQIEVLLKRRTDLIPNILEAVKGYSKYEKETLKDVMNARNKAIEATTKEEEISANKKMQTAIGHIFALVEAYPDLKANTNFMDLQNNLKDTENQISISRQIYNDAVLLYKNKYEMFPSCLIASLFNFKEEIFFDIDESETVNPTIKI